MVTSRHNHGFSLLELVIVVAIIGLLAADVLPSLRAARESGQEAAMRQELHSIRNSLELYRSDIGSYPPDADRSVPPGLESYLTGGSWPDAPYPGGVYDWENWTDSDTGAPIYQISVRFCDKDGSNCRFPDEPWAENFDVNSAAYYCIQGACRAHIDEPVGHPGYCVNC